MGTTTERHRQAHVVLGDALIRAVDAQVGQHRRSRFIEEAVEEKLRRSRRVEALKREGRKSALLLVANAQGEVRFVAVSIE